MSCIIYKMKPITHKLFFTFVLLFIVTTATLACVKKEEAKVPANENPPAEAKIERPPLSEQLSALNLYSYEETVKAPDFELPSIKGPDVTLKQYRGKVVLLSFWTTW